MRRPRSANDKSKNAAEVASGLLILGVALIVLLVACDTKTPVGPGAVTPPSTTTVSPQPGGGTLTATFTVSPTVAAIGQMVTVNGGASTAAPGRQLVAHDWDFGSGVTKSGVTASHQFPAAGAFPIVLTVTDDAGQKATAAQTVTVVQPGATTTTVPPANAVVHYVATPAAPEVPADLTLLFQLLSSGSSFGSRLSLIRPMADPTYGVSGSWISANKQITGGIKGQFVGVLTPTVSGQFTGSLTATVQGAGGAWNDRAVVRRLAGTGPGWAAGAITGPACSPNPWTYGDLSMTQTTAPPPTTTIVDLVDVDEHDHLDVDEHDHLDVDEHQHLDVDEHIDFNDHDQRTDSGGSRSVCTGRDDFLQNRWERQPGNHRSEPGEGKCGWFPDQRFGNAHWRRWSGHLFDSGDCSRQLSRCDDTGTRRVQDWMCSDDCRRRPKRSAGKR